MKRWLLPFGFLIAALSAAFYYEQRQANGRAGFPAPDFSLVDLNGRPQRLADYRGKVVFLNVWATWCAPCRMEMPSMETLHRRMAGTDFVMLAVSEDEDGRTTVQKFADEFGLSFPILLDQQGVIPPRYGVTGYPETFVIDRDGRVIQHTIGPEDWDSDAVVDYFTRLLARGSGAQQANGTGAPSGT